MKNMELVSFSNPTKTALSTLTGQIIKSLLPFAVRKKSFIINDIPRNIEVAADETSVAQILNNILNAFVTYAGDSCIRISLEQTFGNMVQVNIKDNNSCHPYAIACSMQKIVPMAEKIGAHITITNQRQRITTICFRFPLLEQTQGQQAGWRGAA
jgi:signal transduction histidine kinase